MIDKSDSDWIDLSDLYIPQDNDELRDKYEASGKGGTCGPSTIAVIKRTSVQNIIDNWCGGRAAWRGFSPIGEVENTLAFFGFSSKLCHGLKSKNFPHPTTDMAIVRVQWLQKDGTEFYWRAAGPHSHYVLMQKIKDEWWVFCNGDGWFSPRTPFASHKYFEGRGFVSSYLEVDSLHRTGDK